MTQIKWDERETQHEPLEMPRGDTRKYPFPHELGPEAAVKEARFWVRTDDAAETVLVSLSWDSHPDQFDFSEDYICTVIFIAENTVGETLGTHKYGLELVDQDDRVYTPWVGRFSLTDDVVNDDEIAPHLSWATREDLEAEIVALEAFITDFPLSGLASTGDFSWLTEAASGGATTITVENGAIFADTNNIRIMLDDGTYDAEVISGAPAGNVITLAGTLTSAAAVYNIVRRVVP